MVTQQGLELIKALQEAETALERAVPPNTSDDDGTFTAHNVFCTAMKKYIETLFTLILQQDANYLLRVFPRLTGSNEENSTQNIIIQLKKYKKCLLEEVNILRYARRTVLATNAVHTLTYPTDAARALLQVCIAHANNSPDIDTQIQQFKKIAGDPRFQVTTLAVKEALALSILLGSFLIFASVLLGPCGLIITIPCLLVGLIALSHPYGNIYKPTKEAVAAGTKAGEFLTVAANTSESEPEPTKEVVAAGTKTGLLSTAWRHVFLSDTAARDQSAKHAESIELQELTVDGSSLEKGLGA